MVDLSIIIIIIITVDAVNTVTNGPNKIGRINEGFFTRICVAVFARQPSKVAVMRR